MSVAVGDRKPPGQLQAILEARNLAAYTIKITRNEKVFLPEYRSAVVDDIVKTANAIYLKSWAANQIRVRGGEPTGPINARQLAKRLELQQEAIVDCTLLLGLIGLAKPLFHLDGRRVNYWGKWAMRVQDMLRRWHESDRARYKK